MSEDFSWTLTCCRGLNFFCPVRVGLVCTLIISVQTLVALRRWIQLNIPEYGLLIVHWCSFGDSFIMWHHHVSAGCVFIWIWWFDYRVCFVKKVLFSISVISTTDLQNVWARGWKDAGIDAEVCSGWWRFLSNVSTLMDHFSHAKSASSNVRVLLGGVCYWAATQWRSAGLSSVTGFTRSLWAKPTNNRQASCLPSSSGLFQITDWLFEAGWRTGRVFPCFPARNRLGHQQLGHWTHIFNDLCVRPVLT